MSWVVRGSSDKAVPGPQHSHLGQLCFVYLGGCMSPQAGPQLSPSRNQVISGPHHQPSHFPKEARVHF